MILLEKTEAQKRHYERKCEEMAARLRDSEKTLQQLQGDMQRYQVRDVDISLLTRPPFPYIPNSPFPKQIHFQTRTMPSQSPDFAKLILPLVSGRYDFYKTKQFLNITSPLHFFRLHGVKSIPLNEHHFHPNTCTKI